MIIGAYGLFWEEELVDWNARPWRLLGRQGLNSGSLRIVDFRRARGVYILYNDINVYYVGLAVGNNGIGSRIRDHLNDEHSQLWNRFSWFTFDSPDHEGVIGDDGVETVAQTYSGVENLDTKDLIRDLEALLQQAMQPLANKAMTNFAEGEEWYQVANRRPDVLLFEDLAPRLRRDLQEKE